MQICPVYFNDNYLLGLAFMVSTAKKGHNPPSNYKYSKPAQLSKLGVQPHGRSMKNLVPLYSAGSLFLPIWINPKCAIIGGKWILLILAQCSILAEVAHYCP